MAVEPVVVHDFSKQPGQTVQLDRYRFWGKPGTKESRERTADQTLGTASARNIVKDKVLMTLREYTGPADPRDTTQLDFQSCPRDPDHCQASARYRQPERLPPVHRFSDPA